MTTTRREEKLAPTGFAVDGRALLSWNGVAVPWTTLWSGEEQIVFQRAGEWAMVTQVSAQGTGHPLFKHNHPSRVFLSLTRRLCSVCGQPMAEDWAWCVPMDPPGTTNVPELGEPLAHEACLRFSCVQCPALVRRRPPVWGLRSWTVQRRLNLPAGTAAALRAQLPRALAHAQLFSETVFVVDGPLRRLTYDEFLTPTKETSCS